MTTYTYTLTTTRPISAGVAEARGNTRRAHEVIPGATIRGALASLWWRGHDQESADDRAEFAKLFDEQLLVGQAVPDGYELLPASAAICKYRNESSDPRCRSMLAQHGVPGRPSAWTLCAYCGGPLTAKPGWRRSPGTTAVLAARIRGELTDREKAATGQLFTRQALQARNGETVVLTGVMAHPGDGDPLAWMRGCQVRIGGGRSLDFGTCRLDVHPSADEAVPGDGRHLVVLTSPAIVLDAWGGPDLSLEALQREVRRVSGDDARVEARGEWLRSVGVDGWHMRSRLPKPHDWAFAEGTSFVLGGVSRDGWANLRGGIGYRTLEGFGQLRVVPTDALDAEPVNEGRKAAEALRKQLGQRGSAWSRLKRDLVDLLHRVLTDPGLQPSALTTTFSGFDPAQHIGIRKVIGLPLGQIPDAIDELEAHR